jgi:hypothetical protein
MPYLSTVVLKKSSLVSCYHISVSDDQPKVCISTPHTLNRSHTSYLLTYEGGTDRVFRNVGI